VKASKGKPYVKSEKNITGSVQELAGIGAKKAEILQKLNITKIEDFLFFFPRDYQDRRKITNISDLFIGGAFLIKAKVSHLIKPTAYGRASTLKLTAQDETGVIDVVFFNAKYLVNAFRTGEEYFFYGKVTSNRGLAEMLHPEFSVAISNEKSSSKQQSSKMYEGSIIPIYSLTSGISQHEMRKFQKNAAEFLNEVEEYLPDDVIKNNRLCHIQYALSHIHFPEDETKYKEAKFRLIFDELFLLQTGLLLLKSFAQGEKAGVRFSKNDNVNKFINSYPYKLTKAQAKVVKEIFADMESEKVMNRLIQGDVGSGKTAVAEIALYKACLDGYQGVLMAPTELLATQHYHTLKNNFAKFDIEVSLILGSKSGKERKEALDALKSGKTKIAVGTHALIQAGVEFNNLGLVITDEQHRFGVHQRKLLTQKGENPDVLVMSATPIPRTLAMILYGDLDISIIDELPPGRQKIITKSANKKQRTAAYDFLETELKAGRQSYVVTPLIDDSEAILAKSAESVFKELTKRFSKYKVALMHGEMKQKEKDETMQKFYGGEIDVLVSTVVIEVGINVPNATVMIIENAERFGLAQLHQLRGRVGRGTEKSYCILIVENQTELAKQRAEAMVNTNDGFAIAEQDLELRGPGEFFGTKQHGIPDLKIANLVKHIDILENVRDEAKKMLKKDSDLSLPEHLKLKAKIQGKFGVVL